MKILILLVFPGSIAAFHLLRKYSADAAAWLVLAMSLAVYASLDRAGLPLLLASILFNYWLTGIILRDVSRRRFWVTVGIAANLLPLIFYKYLRAPVPVSSTGLLVVAGIPLGLSFYTFQQITSLFDVQEADALRLPLFRHALFSAFFAQIPSGPVSRYRDLAPQMERLGRWPVTLSTVLAGISLFLVGLAKKTFLADPLGDTVNGLQLLAAGGQHLSMAEAWFAVWGFVLQLYFDFSGYSDMALGAALCFGITLPANFNSPLKSVTAAEFVSRWHMSLVNWIREYLFQPVYDGVRKLHLGSRRATRTAAWTVATVTSMTVIGAWHGRQISLVLEGFLSGIVIVLTQRLGRGKRAHRGSQSGSLHLLSRVRLMVIVSVLMLALRAGSFAALVSVLRSMVDVRLLLPAGTAGSAHRSLAPHGLIGVEGCVYLVVAMAIVFALPNTMQMFDLLPPGTPSARTGEQAVPPRLQWRTSLQWGMAIGGLALLELVFSVGRGQGFIYAAF